MHHVYNPRELPDSLEGLVELALDLRWSTTRAADHLWNRVDADTWRALASPWLILQNLSEQRVKELAADRDFVHTLENARAARQRDLDGETWFTRNIGRAKEGIAYFSMEFGLSEALPLYSGGLGILAGDYLKSANDLGLPVTGVGLLYQEGYFRQVLSSDGWQQEVYPYNEAVSLPVQPVISDRGWLRVQVELPGRSVHLRVWEAKVGRVSLYLLDSDDPFNSPADCTLTGKLYGGNQETRIQQEIILGIGGWRALEALGIPIGVCHLNEGHAAFVTLERARSFMELNGTTFWEAIWATRPGNVFTTHTAVAAGFDKFEPDLARKYLGAVLALWGERAPQLEDVLAMGRQTGWNGSEPLNMAYLALRGCGSANGVSELHGQVSRNLFANLYPRWPEQEVPVTSVTNGVHIPTWISDVAENLWDGHGRENISPANISDEALWTVRNRGRERLVAFARERLARQLGRRGVSADALAEARHALDPAFLTLGFARRFAEYKRPNLLLRNPDRFRDLLLNREKPVQILIAGKAHPADDNGKRLIQNWIHWIEGAGVQTRAVFLEDYDIELTQYLVAGVDVWINTPRRPWEASGTSGMKLLANGGLNLSELDGWWIEAYRPEVGWAIGDGQVHQAGSEDDAEAEQLYRLLENEVIPKFYRRDGSGIGREWVQEIRASMEALARQFSSDRMCQDYVEKLYKPAFAGWERRSAQRGKLGKELSDWQSTVQKRWSAVHFGELRTEENGANRHYRTEVFLGDLHPEDIRVELFADSKDSGEPFRKEMLRGEGVEGTKGAFWFEAVLENSRPPDDFTPRIIPGRADIFVPGEMSEILWR